ncbi:MAG: HdeD family acid-resistance protein [Streptosporangiaceae bacterium]|nr:HdeD family acid-resistance protein [Streptosporangiaceae bacterium]
MLKSLSTSLIVRGVLALAVGIIALAWPQVTVLALVILFAVYAFIAAGLEAVRAFSSAKAGPVFGHLLLGLVDIAAGVIALAWPGPTALVLVLIVGIWAVIGGLVEIAAAFQAGEPAGTRATFILGGLAAVAFGVVLCARPGLGAITLALLFGLFNLVYGVWALVQGVELRRARKTLPSVIKPREAADNMPSPSRRTAQR